MSDEQFRIFAPISLFEKADAAEGQRRRIAGIISTEKLDKQGEVVVQKGLDFGHFLSQGHLNDNHSKKTADVLGFPVGVSRFTKGEKLPDGKSAPSNCTWMEGYLYDTPEATRIWDLGRAMAKAGNARRLGYSIEGNVVRRDGDGKIVAKAMVRNVAITNCPVGEDTRLETLAKALTASPPAGAGSAAEAGPQTGEGAGFLLAHRSVEGVVKKDDEDSNDNPELAKSEAVFLIAHRLGCSEADATRVFDTISLMKERRAL